MVKFLGKIIYSLTKEPYYRYQVKKMEKFPYMLMVNLISRKSIPPFQKQPFADALQSRCS